MRMTGSLASLAPLAPLVLLFGLSLACSDDGGGSEAPTETASETGDGDGDVSTTGDGDGDGDGDGNAECDVVRIATTMGDLVVTLDPVEAPITVANFKAYVDAGYYDGVLFHRVINDFMIQGGGLLPGMIPKEAGLMPPIPLELSSLTHVDGAISMARTNEPNSATSQFFICDGPQDFLDNNYAAFGVLTEGFEVLDAISAVPTTAALPYEDVPVEDILIQSVSYACG